MKIMLRAAISVLSLSIGSAYATDSTCGNAQVSNTPPVVAQAPVQYAPSAAPIQDGRVVHASVNNSNRGSPFLLNERGGAQ
jgi:hypothetical protein